VSQRIVGKTMEHKQGNNILEVGPGKGALTKYFLEQDIVYKAVELDWDMIHHLQQELGLTEERLIQADFLKLPLETVFDQSEYNVVGNFPYNVSSQILFKIFKYRDLIPIVIGMFQSEVAERIAAPPGSKTYGVISVLLQASYIPQIIIRVSPGSFFPIPKVNSAVLMLKRKPEYRLPCDENLFRSIVKTAFNQRRKMLRNTLKPFIKDPDLFVNEMMTQRPEQLSVKDFTYLTNLITQQQ